jgi:small-conductance mechanosensitive channel
MDQASGLIDPLLVVAIAAVVAWLLAVAADWAVRRKQRRSSAVVWPSLHRRCRVPLQVSLVIAAVLVALPDAEMSARIVELVRHSLSIALIAAVSWLVIQLTGVVEDVTLARTNIDVRDNRKARRLRTQILVLRRATVAVVIFIAIAAVLMTFPRVRTLGASFLLSAGVIGVVVGLAAQATLGNLFAGLQIALTDPIRIDDVVVVNNEWGRIEEITLTYVVLRLWDNRRLILPVSWFTTNVFQNWTRHEARVLGSVLLHVDFDVPIDDLRAEFRRLLQESPLWDGRDWVLQVVDTTPSTLVVRGLMSSVDATSNWDLRCEVREKLLAFLQQRYPRSLPKIRADVSIGDGRLDATNSKATVGRSAVAPGGP